MSHEIMLFRQVASALTNEVLGPKALGRFEIIGHQRQVRAAESDLKKLVQVFYQSGQISTRGSGINGPKQHDMTFIIEMTVAAAASTDLYTINNDESTEDERGQAIRNSLEATERADKALDELIDIVWNILEDARNIDLGMPVGTVANRSVNQIEKDEPEMEGGEYVILTGKMILTARVAETIHGDKGVSGEKTFETTLDIEGDDIEKTGADVSQ
jgi:hypothetical protein